MIDRRLRVWVLLAIASFSLSCGGGGSGSPDAAHVDSSPMIDAPHTIDAPVDSPRAIDAAVDAPHPDAAIDAPPVNPPTVTNVVVTATSPDNGATPFNTGTATAVLTGTDFATVTCPTGVALDDLDGAGSAAHTHATSCTVDSDTQITAVFPAGIRTNGSAGWNVIVTNHAGSNATSAVPFVPRAGLVISEIYPGTAGATDHEFVELYNPTATALDPTALGLHLHTRAGTGTATDKTLTAVTTAAIPSHGFFLLASSASGSGDSWFAHEDRTYSAALVGNGGVYVSLSATGDAKVLDKAGWGTQPAPGFEGSAMADIPTSKSAERKPAGGLGHATDTDDNSADFAAASTTLTPRGTGDPAEPNATFDVTSAASTSHTGVTVTFDAPPDPTAAATATNYTIPGLAVSSATLAGSTVTLVTSGQTATAFTVTVANVTRAGDGKALTTASATFTGRAAFSVASAASASATSVTVTFTDPPDATTGGLLANYAIAGLTLGGTPVIAGSTVTLTTSAQTATPFTVVVSNVVRASDAEPLTTNSATFTGTAPAGPTVTNVVVASTSPDNGTTAFNTGTTTITITGTSFATVLCPGGVALDDQDGSGGSVHTPATSCSVDSDTQITATLPKGIRTNGAAGWNVIVTNATGANTTSGAPFVPRAGLLISEIYTGTTGATDHEYLEVYNPTATAINPTAIGLSLHVRGSTGTDSNRPLTPVTTNAVPSHGFLLLASSASAAGDAWFSHIDMTYSASTGLVANGGAYLSLSAGANLAVLDKVGWGTQSGAGVEGAAAANIPSGVSSERKPAGGAGDATDTDDNSNDLLAPTATLTPLGTVDPIQPAATGSCPFTGTYTLSTYACDTTDITAAWKSVIPTTTVTFTSDGTGCQLDPVYTSSACTEGEEAHVTNVGASATFSWTGVTSCSPASCQFSANDAPCSVGDRVSSGPGSLVAEGQGVRLRYNFNDDVCNGVEASILLLP